MSRTIKFRIENDTEFSVAQLRMLYNISNFYANNIHWTLDSFSIGPGKIEPVLFDHLEDTTCWDILDKCIHGYVLLGDHYIDAIIKADSKNQARSIESLHTNTYSGEVRVLGNESNARDVIKALSECSLVFPKSTIYVSDQGHYLYTDLIIQRGMAIPDVRWLKTFMQDFITFTTSFKGDVQIRASDKVMLRFYISDCQVRMKSLHTILHKLRDTLGLDKIMPEDLQNVDQKLWPEIDFYTRHVDLDKFSNYEKTPSNLMGGYFGENWGLVAIDVEEESYRILGSIQSALTETDPKFKLQIF